jgi:hypothetical protein
MVMRIVENSSPLCEFLTPLISECVRSRSLLKLLNVGGNPRQTGLSALKAWLGVVIPQITQDSLWFPVSCQLGDTRMRPSNIE